MTDHSGLRIAQLANFVGPVSGGMRTVVDQLGRGYADSGAERVVVVPGEADDVRETAAGIVVAVRSPRLAQGYRMIAQPWRVLDVLDQFRPTSVEVSDKWTLSPVAGWAARRGIGSVLFSHERLDTALASFLRRPGARVPMVRALNSWLAQAFDRVVVASDYTAQEWRSVGVDPIHVPLGVDLATFRPAAPSRPEDRVLRLALVSRLSREKTPQLAVATLFELHRRGIPVRLDVYGSGPLRKQLVKEAAGLPVYFHGHLSEPARLAEVLAAADIALSICSVEAFGLATLEALACGVPVVAVNHGGHRELLARDCGILAEPHPSALADAVLELSDRPRDESTPAARRRAEQFTWSACVRRMLDLHAQLAREAPRRAMRGSGLV